MKTYKHRYDVFGLMMSACLLASACSLQRADLSVVSVSGPPGSVKATDPWPLGCVVANLGSAGAPATTVRFRYSADAVLDAGDPEIGSASVSALTPSASVAVPYPVLYAVDASGGSAGTRYVFAVVDPSALFEDEDRSNNTRSLQVAVRYERLVVDTYKHDALADLLGQPDTVAALFDALGEGGIALATDDDFTNPTYPLAARIDYTDLVGFAPGTVLYVKVTGKGGTFDGPYAIRLVTTDADLAVAYDAKWRFSTPANDSAYEPDDAVSAGIPTGPVELVVGGKLNRALVAADADWFRLVLP